MLKALWLTGNGGRHKHDIEVGVGVGDNEQRYPYALYLYAQLFAELPARCVRVILSRFAFSSRELPQPAVLLVLRSLTDENFRRRLVAAEDHRGHDANASALMPQGVTLMRYCAYHPR